MLNAGSLKDKACNLSQSCAKVIGKLSKLYYNLRVYKKINCEN